jgi:uncharacterized protein
MANWGRIASRGHVEDRRGFAPVAGGLSLTSLAVVMFVTYLMGGDVTDVLNQLPQNPVPQNQYVNTQEFEGEDDYEVFASTVLGSNNEMWSALLANTGDTYTPPTLVLFRSATTSGCGTATSQVGPHYCPLDKTIYLDETFFDELTTRFGAQGGDVAEAYVIAHEVGHHVQNELQIMEEVRYQEQVSPDRANEYSVKLELQADCFAGLWAHSIKDQGVFSQGEIFEAIDAAEAVGDDRIQERVTGYTNPETWTHGSSEQRKQWFTKGYEAGNLAACDTFNE